MQILDNINNTIKDDLQKEVKKGSKISIAAACFSIYAYQELKKQLEGVEELHFIFTSPTFITEKTPKAKREFYIPRLSRERSLYGTEFEVKLRNELTQKAIAKECAEWIRKKVVFKSNITQEQMMGFITVDESTYMPINGFTTVDLGCERGNNAYYPVQKTESFENANYFLKLFDDLWHDDKKLQEVTDIVIESISTAYKENSPDFIYFFTLYNIFNEFLEDISDDELPNEATGFKDSKIWGMLYNFQRDAVLAIISKLEKFNGCILADSVGLGKTFTALAVIKYYENRNKSVLVLCPKKLSENWNTYKGNYINNPIASDRLRYDVLYHTDLSREHGTSNGIELDRLNWGNYDLVVIDESHNFRNGGEITGEDAKENRYLKLLNRVIRAGVRTKVLMLSATPVNNKFIDLKNQLALAYEGDAAQINEKLDTTKSIDEIFRQAQTAFNAWSKLPTDQRTTDALLKTLDFDFFELLDSVTIARSRKHIEKYYNTADIGNFPSRLPPISLRPCLTDLDGAINYNEIYNLLMSLSLTIYTPSSYIMPSKMAKYIDLTHNKGTSLTQKGREEGIRRLMSINLLKRLESSVYSFRLTLDRIKELINGTIQTIKNYRSGGCMLDLTDMSNAQDFDYDDQNTDFFSVGKKVKIDLADMDYVSWQRELEKDADNLELLSLMIADITPEHDTKLQTLFDTIRSKQKHPINPGNRIFDLALHGAGAAKITKTLIAEKVPTAGWLNYQRYGTFANIYANAPEEKSYAWTIAQVKSILQDETYIGNSVHNKQTNISYKNKKKVRKPKEEWIRVENTHEAIISRDVFEQVQKQIASRRRQQKDATTQIFAGLVKCADCGWSMRFGTNRQNKTPYSHFTCSQYGQMGTQCSAHYIRYDTLYVYVLSRIQYWSHRAQLSEEKLLQQILKNGDRERITAAKRQESELKRAEKRKAEVDGKFVRMYEDWSAGRITEYNFNLLTKKYQAEQLELEEKISRLQAELTAEQQTALDAEKWVALIKQYANPTELTAELLNTLIEKIVIHEATKGADGMRDQEIEIYYRFIGKID
ncbi:MAG TPA: DUF4368 domain-containing protein [Candidatus Lawsonibacter pullicola]|nr:DUF4368 domain-containing protein [Candidatus Lawsonibacter pullicola]